MIAVRERGRLALGISQRRLIAVAATVVVALASLTLFLEVRWHSPQSYAGDEPHHLIITNSLILDGDVDVKNDYLDHRYLTYYPYPIDPHVNPAVFTGDSRHWYSEHAPGFPALLVPGVLLAGARGGADEMAGIAVLVLLLAFLWIRRFVREVWPAVISVAALGFSPFYLGQAGRIFPDLVAAALLLGALLILERPDRTRWQLLLLGLLAGISPWIHAKNALALGTVVAIAFVQISRSTAGTDRVVRLLLLCAPALCSLIGYEWALRAWYDSWLPGRMIIGGSRVFALSEPRGISAVSFDSARGLFPNAPALLLVLAGLPLWYARFRHSFVRLALIIGPTILIDATFSDWSGGFSAPGRYAADFVPLLLPAIALVLRQAPRIFRGIATVLLLANWVLAGMYVWLRPSWALTGARSPFFAAIERHVGPAFDRAMPTFDYFGTVVRGQLQLAAWITVACLLLAYGVHLSRPALSSSRSRTS